jgi:SAM-dependent methyltransferase
LVEIRPLSLKNLLRYGLGARAKERKKEAKLRRRSALFEDRSIWDVGDTFARRKYRSYEEYLSHQAAKLEGHVAQLRTTEEEDFQEFRRRFSSCAPLSSAKSVLCLGARLGTEVRALHSLGYFAVGIDLNPGEGNSYVLPGDFHHLVFADSSVDAVYTNAVDHSFDLGRFVGEVRRVLRPAGVFVMDFQSGFEEGQEPGDFESIHWKSAEALLQLVAAEGGLALEEHRPLGALRTSAWRQAVFRKEQRAAS